MAKQRKSSRPNLPEQTLARARAELAGEQPVFQTAPSAGSTPAAAAVAAVPRRVVTKNVSIDDLKNDYMYVINDLRSMFLLAGILIAALIVASLILL